MIRRKWRAYAKKQLKNATIGPPKKRRRRSKRKPMSKRKKMFLRDLAIAVGQFVATAILVIIALPLFLLGGRK